MAEESQDGLLTLTGSEYDKAFASRMAPLRNEVAQAAGKVLCSPTEDELEKWKECHQQAYNSEDQKKCDRKTCDHGELTDNAQREIKATYWKKSKTTMPGWTE